MTSRDYFKSGAYNCICPVCGRKRKNDEMKERWDGVMVCAEDWEPRHPQEFVRIVEEANPPWTAPEQPDRFIDMDNPVQLP